MFKAARANEQSTTEAGYGVGWAEARVALSLSLSLSLSLCLSFSGLVVDEIEARSNGGFRMFDSLKAKKREWVGTGLYRWSQSAREDTKTMREWGAGLASAVRPSVAREQRRRGTSRETTLCTTTGLSC